jgi:hypothetical protein
VRKIKLILLFLLIVYQGVGQSPHGEDLEFDCGVCHTSESWKLDPNQLTFDHSQTGFALNGQHKNLECLMCHEDLVLSNVKNDCVACHTDIHEQTLGNDCRQCHSENNWLIFNPVKLHQNSRFPLLGVHAVADCEQCHTSVSLLKFEPLGIDCYNCHQQNYTSTTQPNHVEEGYSTNCLDCHSAKAYEWSATGFNHDFFPLTQGHFSLECAQCHTENVNSSISAECVECHLEDFNNAENPTHDRDNFSLSCTECHSISVDWQPADFRIHDAVSFPVYSGKHRGEWKSCTECHTNSSNYAVFTCIDCHEHNRSKMNNEHDDERNYVYESNACYECHPRGTEDD